MSYEMFNLRDGRDHAIYSVTCSHLTEFGNSTKGCLS